jgi:hypothetical protein
MFRLKFLSLVMALMTIASFQVSAKSFSNGYTQFELPVGWECFLEGSEYVCQSENADRKKEAIIILAAKKRGSQDSLGAYQKYLGQPRVYSLPGNRKQISEAKKVTVVNINNHKWVDSLHMASEVPGFYTRYLATVKAGIGVAITFSVTKSMYDAYKGIFDNVIKSMRVFAQSNPNLAGIKLSGKNNGENFADATFDNGEGAFGLDVPTVKNKNESGGAGDNDFMFLAIIGAVLVLVILKLKSKKKK